MRKRQKPEPHKTLDEAFQHSYKTIFKFKDFTNELELKTESYKVQIWNQLVRKGISLDNLKRISNRLIVMERIKTEEIDSILNDKFLGIEEIFKLASCFSKDEQAEYLSLLNPTAEQKRNGIPGGKKSNLCKNFWKENYKKNLNLKEEEVDMIEQDNPLFNPYDEYMRNDYET